MLLKHRLAGSVECAVDACRLQVDIEDAELLAIDIDICPHGTVVGLLEENGLAARDGVAAEDDHITATNLLIGEILFVAL